MAWKGGIRIQIHVLHSPALEGRGVECSCIVLGGLWLRWRKDGRVYDGFYLYASVTDGESCMDGG